MTQQQQDPWGDPTGNSNLFSPSNHVGAVVLFAVRALHPNLPGSFGTRDAIECGVDIITESGSPSPVSRRFEDVLVYGAALVPELADKIGQQVLGRLMAKPSKNPQPTIVLEPCTDQEKELAREYVARMGLQDTTPKSAQQVAQTNQAHAQAFQQMQQPQWQPAQQGQPQQGQVGQPAPWQQPGQQSNNPPF